MKPSLLKQSPLATLILMLSAMGIFACLLFQITTLTSSTVQGLALVALGGATVWMVLLRGIASPTLVWSFTLISLAEWLWRGGGTGSWLLVFGAVGLISEARQARSPSPQVLTLQASLGLSLGGVVLALCGFPYKGALLASCGGIFAVWQKTGRSVRYLSSFFPLLLLFLFYYLAAARALHHEFLYRYSGDQEILLDSAFLFSRLGVLAALGCLSAISSHSRKLGMFGAILCGTIAAWDYSLSLSGFGILFPWEFSAATSVPLAFSSGAVLPIGAALWGIFQRKGQTAYQAPKDDLILSKVISWGTILSLTLIAAALITAYKSTQNSARNLSPKENLHVPPHLIQNMLQAEDLIFFEHHGIDWARLKSVIVRSLNNGAMGRGASTISMQLGKIFYLSYEPTLWRKAQQMILGVAYESHFSKEEILAKYLSVMDFGEGGIGIDSGALFYFKKKPSQLNENESIMLVMTIPDPYTLNPLIIEKSPKLLRKVSLAKARSRVLHSLFASQISKLSLVSPDHE